MNADGSPAEIYNIPMDEILKSVVHTNAAPSEPKPEPPAPKPKKTVKAKPVTSPEKAEQIEKAIQELETTLTIQLQLSANEKVRLTRLALDAHQTIDNYIVDLIRTQLSKRVGAPAISRPSQLSGAKTSLVSTPTGTSRRVN